MLLFDQFNENVLTSRVSVVNWPHNSWFLGSFEVFAATSLAAAFYRPNQG